MPRVPLKPLRAVIRWQVLLAAIMAAIGGLVAGYHAALSAALGGMVTIGAGLGYMFIASLHRGSSEASVLIAALRAEAVKVLLKVLLLWLVLATYKDVVVVWLIGAFIISVLTFGMAAFLGDE